MITHAQWSAVDWSRNNREIAQEMGCSRSTVSKRRKIYSNAAPVVKKLHPLKGFDRWAEMSNAAICKQFKLPRYVVQNYRSRHRLPPGPRSPGSGLWQKRKSPRVFTKREKAARLDAVWAFLWPTDPVNAAGRDEVEAIKNLLANR